MIHPPSSIETILHFFYSPEPHPRQDAPAIANAINHFCHIGLLRYDDKEKTYKVTDRGFLWVEMICSTPYPEMIWIDPRTNERVIASDAMMAEREQLKASV